MNKTNVIRSSEFHMDVNDVLHLLFLDETGVTPTLMLVSTGDNDNLDEVPDAVVATEASDITDSSFTANWNFMENSLGYYLDVATDIAFTSMVAGYNNLSVGNVNEYDVVGLNSAFTYYYRVRASNTIGTGQSSNIITLLTDIETVTDEDGNVYTYVTIGTQQWMVENLKTTKYRDGTPIPNLTLDADWIAEDGSGGHDGAYCWYNNDIANKTPYGALYNWYAVDNAHLLAPTGWRVPTKTDIETLVTYAGEFNDASIKLKEVGLEHWTADFGTDDYGFKLLGGGRRNNSGVFGQLKDYANLWSSTPVDGTTSELCYVAQDNSGGITPYIKQYGCSVRCMRDI